MSAKASELSQKMIGATFEKLGDPGTAPLKRAGMLAKTLQQLGEDPTVQKLLAQFLLGTDQMRSMLEAAPRKTGRFLKSYDDRRALVLLENGQAAYPLIADEELASSLQCGDCLVLDQHGAYVLSRIEPPSALPGATVVFERLISPHIVEIRRDHADMPEHFLLSAQLTKSLAAHAPKRGDRLLVSLEQKLALGVVPPEDGEKRWRYLLDSPLPDIRIERDLGDPQPVLHEILRDVRQEMLAPRLRRMFKLSPGSFHVWTGASGTGKTYSLMALVTAIYGVMSEVTGAAKEDLPCRVMELRTSGVLSEWLGRSEKNLRDFTRELEELAGMPWTAPDGRQWRLPMIVHMPEIDGLARRRSSGAHDDNGAMDRILCSFLDMFDPLRLGNKHIICIATSNLMDRGAIDEAMMRRLGGRVTVFRRLSSRPSLHAVLLKHLNIPLGPDGQQSAEEVAALLGDRIFGNAQLEQPLAEITLGGTAAPLLKRRRDFLTHDLIRRAVQEATSRTCRESTLAPENGMETGDGEHAPKFGVTVAALEAALDEQVRSVVAQLTEFNAASLTDLPDGSRVAAVRRFDPPPAVLQFQREYPRQVA